MADKTKVFSKRDKNVDYMNQMLPVEDSFDIVQRDIQIVVVKHFCNTYG